MQRRLFPHIALMMVNLLYGANYVIAKEAMPEFILPFGFIVIRVSCACLIFFLIHRLYFNESVEKKDFPRLMACGLFGIVINQLLFFKGLSLTSPINASLIMITIPIMLMIFSAWLIGEEMNLKKWGGILAGAIGAGILIWFSQKGGSGQSNLLGDLFIFINATSYAFYLVLVIPLMKKYHPMTIIKWVFFFGLFGVWPAGYQEFMQIEWSSFTPKVWWVVAYVVIGTTFLAYMLNIYALSKVNPSVVGIYVYTQPIIATLIAVGLGKDQIDVIKLLAAAFIFLGVFLVSFSKQGSVEQTATNSDQGTSLRKG